MRGHTSIVTVFSVVSLSLQHPTTTPRVAMFGRPAGTCRRRPTPWSVWPKARLLWLRVGLGRCRQRRGQPSPPTRPCPRETRATRAGGEKHTEEEYKKKKEDPTRKPSRGESADGAPGGGPLCARRAQGSVCGREAPAGGGGDPPETHNNSCAVQHSQHVVSLFRHFKTRHSPSSPLLPAHAHLHKNMRLQQHFLSFLFLSPTPHTACVSQCSAARRPAAPHAVVCLA